MAKGKPTIQAKRAIDALLAAGFRRGEFKVTTEKRYYKELDGRRAYEWGSARISLRATLEREIELTPAMLAQDLHVSHYLWKAEGEDTRRVHMVLVDTDYAKRGTLTTYNI
jgi:hypothetical protein